MSQVMSFDTLPVEENVEARIQLEGTGGGGVISLANLQTLLPFIEGKVLTVIDASIADREQRKAIKDLVREAVWDGLHRTIISGDVEYVFTVLGNASKIYFAKDQKRNK